MWLWSRAVAVAHPPLVGLGVESGPRAARTSLLVGLCALVCLCAPVSATQASQDPVPVGAAVGLPPYAIEVSGGYAYCLADDVRGFDNSSERPTTSALEVFDVSDPTQPELAGLVRLPYRAVKLAASTGYVCVVDPSRQITVFDTSEPTLPVQAAVWGGALAVSDVVAAGDYVYVTAGEDGLRILDLSDPTNPVEVGSLVPAEASLGALAVAGGRAYAMLSDPTAGRGLAVIDVSQPSAPVLLSNTPAYVGGRGLAVAGDYVYLDSSTSIALFDVSDPHAPEYLGYYAGYYVEGGEFLVVDNHAYAACDGQGLGVMDVSVPAPSEWHSHTVPTPGHALAIAAADSHVYLADYEGGIRSYDVSTPGTPAEIGAHSTPGFAHNITLSGDLAGVACWHGHDMELFDISEPARPVYLAGARIGNFGTDVVISGDYAFATSVGTASWFAIHDISRPEAPRKLWDTEGSAHSLAVSDDHAYVPRAGRLHTWDVSDPEAPVDRGSCSLSTYPDDMLVSGGYAYLACGPDGMVVLDVSDPRQPREVAAVDTPDWASSVALAGRYAFVGDGTSLRVFDTASPTAPAEVSALEPAEGRIEDVAVLGSYLYAADRYYGLRIIGISDPLNLVEAGGIEIPEGAGGEYATPVGTCGVAAQGNHVYVAVFGWGILVFETESTFADVPPDYWATDAVERCLAAGIVAGYDEGSYQPRGAVSRDMMAVYIARAAAGGDANVPDGPPAASFPDVPADHWAYDYVEYAAAHGVVAGYGDGAYRPGDEVDRAEMAVYIARSRGWVGIDDDMSTAAELFPDVPAGHWAGTAIEACLANGVIQGYPDGHYVPDSVVTRDQMAVYIVRAFEVTR